MLMARVKEKISWEGKAKLLETNAGGLRVVKFMLHGQVLNFENRANWIS